MGGVQCRHSAYNEYSLWKRLVQEQLQFAQKSDACWTLCHSSRPTCDCPRLASQLAIACRSSSATGSAYWVTPPPVVVFGQRPLGQGRPLFEPQWCCQGCMTHACHACGSVFCPHSNQTESPCNRHVRARPWFVWHVRGMENDMQSNTELF